MQIILYLCKWSMKNVLSHDVVSWSNIRLCNKIDIPLVVYRFSGNMMSIIKLRKIWQNLDIFTAEM